MAASRPHRIARAALLPALLALALTPVLPAADGGSSEPAAYAVGDVFIMLQTDPNGEAGTFSFTHNLISSPSVATPFTLQDGRLEIFNSVPVGVYSIAMTASPDWEIVALGDGYDSGCWDDQLNSTLDRSSGVATIDVSAGEFIVCTYVVRKKATEPSVTEPLLSSPRGTGFWKNWGGCAAKGRSNSVGARETALVRRSIRAGAALYPVGGVDGMTCEEATHLLSRQSFDGTLRANDAAYQLASQLMAAKLNREAGVPVPACVEAAISDAEALLAGIGFDGTGDYLGPRSSNPARTAAQQLAGQLAGWNDGGGGC